MFVIAVKPQATTGTLADTGAGTIAAPVLLDPRADNCELDSETIG
jgi:hypothetical protein